MRNVIPFEPVHTTPWHALPDAPSAPAEIAVIIPTLNERDNVVALIEALDDALNGYRAELLFVDDWSTDGTAEVIAGIARRRPDVRLIRRYGRKGLSSAVVEGMMATTAELVVVIDADLQHDERILPLMIEAVRRDGADVAIGSRYTANGSCGEWSESRQRASRIATMLAGKLLPAPVSDPMSGFFAIRRDLAVALVPQLSGRGFKILLDLLSSAPATIEVREVPYRFRNRRAGASKLGAGVMLDYLLLLIDKTVRNLVPARLLLFGAVGAFGLVVHLAVLRALLDHTVTGFATAQAAAVACAIAVNFFLNNAITFRDRRLSGRKLLTGLASFYLVCGAGALANVGVGTLVFATEHRWWLGGVAGAVIGSVWNFAASSVVTWRRV